MTKKSTGEEFAMKTIPKQPPNERESKSPQSYLEKLVSEVRVMQHIGPSLNVVYLYEVFEDESHIHLVMEYCRGGVRALPTPLPNTQERRRRRYAWSEVLGACCKEDLLLEDAILNVLILGIFHPGLIGLRIFHPACLVGMGMLHVSPNLMDYRVVKKVLAASLTFTYGKHVPFGFLGQLLPTSPSYDDVF